LRAVTEPPAVAVAVAVAGRVGVAVAHPDGLRTLGADPIVPGADGGSDPKRVARSSAEWR